MSNSLIAKPEAAKELDLGLIICKFCGDVIGTIPTNGITKIYGVCKEAACGRHQEGGQ